MKGHLTLALPSKYLPDLDIEIDHNHGMTKVARMLYLTSVVNAKVHDNVMSSRYPDADCMLIPGGNRLIVPQVPSSSKVYVQNHSL